MPPSNRRNKVSQKPPEAMTWKKATFVIIAAIVFDALRFMFEMFWFFGPALATLYCTAKGSNIVGTTLAATGCSAAAGTIGFFGTPIIATFGVVMAMATGFAGWLIIGTIILGTNKRVLTDNKAWFVGSFMLSEIPFIGSLPVFTGTILKMYRSQIMREQAALKKWEAEHAAEIAQARREQQQQAAQMMQMQNMQLQQAQQEAADEEAAAEAANDEIPEEVRKAA
jgi:hypothetical protein